MFKMFVNLKKIEIGTSLKVIINVFGLKLFNQSMPQLYNGNKPHKQVIQYTKIVVCMLLRVSFYFFSIMNRFSGLVISKHHCGVVDVYTFGSFIMLSLDLFIDLLFRSALEDCIRIDTRFYMLCNPCKSINILCLCRGWS